MRTCESCGRKNANDVDFCSCGAYLRWEATVIGMPAVTPPAQPEEPQEPAKPAPTAQYPAAAPPHPLDTQAPASRPAAPPPPPSPPKPPPTPRDGPPQPRPRPRGGPPPQPRTAPPPPEPAGRASSAAAAITLRLPDDDSGGAGSLAMAAKPGERTRILALVRNSSEVVDNYSLFVHGLPTEWYTVIPETIYLVPFGSAGAYEQDVEIHLHPPRVPEAEARRWDLRVGVISRAYSAEVAWAPLTLGILPYEDYALRVRPERASGRRRGKFDVAITNRANAVVLLALDAHDSDDACRFEFERDTVELPAAQTKIVRMRCKPPRQIWLGRPLERRLEIAGAAGEAGEALLAEKALAKAQAQAGKRKGRGGMPALPGGVVAPKVNIPNLSIGPDGKPDLRMPNVRGPQFQGVNLRRPTMGLKALKMPGQAAAAPDVMSAPLLPTQAIFRQKPWLPWWLAIVVPLLALLLVALLLLLPKNVDVPDVKGSESVFKAEQKLIAAGLQLNPTTKDRVSAKAKPGSVLAQTPEAGASAKKGSTVTLQIAVGTGATKVPKLAGLTLADADRALRDADLTTGTLSVQPPDPKLKIESTIPPAGDSVAVGSAVNIFYPVAKPGGGGAKPGGGAAGGGGGGGPVTIPKIDPTDQQGYAKALATAGLSVAPTQRRIDTAPRGTVIGTDPAVGTKVEKGTAVTMLVSAGFPRVAYDNDQNVFLGQGSTPKRIPPAIAKTDAVEKDPTWSADGDRVVYTAGGQLMSANMIQRDRPPIALRPADEQYADPSFAPITARSVLAVTRVDGTDHDLCFGNVKPGGFTPQCIADPGTDVGFAHWAPDGKSIIAPANSDKGFGIVRYTSRKAFSASKDNWSPGEFVTTPSTTKVVFDMALSPDGKTLAAVANLDSQVPQLYLTAPDDFALEKAKPLSIRACKVVWVDSAILALVDLGNDCAQDFGRIFRIDIGKPSEQLEIATAGDNPTFKPLAAGG